MTFYLSNLKVILSYLDFKDKLLKKIIDNKDFHCDYKCFY